jgi:hypothetical protein
MTVHDDIRGDRRSPLPWRYADASYNYTTRILVVVGRFVEDPRLPVFLGPFQNYSPCMTWLKGQWTIVRYVSGKPEPST